jgi:hypothetical protein
MSYEIKDEFIQNRLHEIAKSIQKWIPTNWGFTIFLFGFGENQPLFYISSARRDDMIKTVKEWLEKQEKEKE